VNLINMDKVMRRAMATMMAGVNEAQHRDETHEWWRRVVRPYIARRARDVIEEHRKRGEPLVLLTSSSPYAAEMALADFGLEYAITNHFEIVDGHFTGEPVKPICYGRGKVTYAEAWAKAHDIDLSASTFNTDSLSDIPMLERVGKPHVVNPDTRLRWAANRRGWPVSDWS
jgi:HAD superfamily hydrolase (TIGR01490 family)